MTGVLVIRNIVSGSHWPGDAGIFGAVIRNTVAGSAILMTLGLLWQQTGTQMLAAVV